MYADEFTLYDEDHNEVLSRNIVGHIQLAIIEQGLLTGDNTGRHYTIVSDVSGYEMEVDNDTTAEEWREYADKCKMALD